MTEAIHRILAQPERLALLSVLPLLAIGTYLAARRRRRLLLRLGSSQSIRSLTTPGPRHAWLLDLFWTLGITLLIVGIAGPQWGRDETVAAAPGRDIMLVLDLSRSMLAEDVLPNRAMRAKQALSDLIDAVGRRGGHRLGLVAFAAGAQVVCPLTQDYDHLRAALAALDPSRPPAALWRLAAAPASGTRIGAGLRAAVEAHDRAAAGYQDILIISDGDDPAHDEEWRAGARAAAERGIPVHAVGVGDPTAASPIPGKDGKPLVYEGQVVTTRLDEEPLALLSRWTGGVYVAARTDQLSLGKVFREHIESASRREMPDSFLPAYRQRYPWFFSAAILALSLNMALGGWRSRLGGAIRHNRANRLKPAFGVFSALLAVFFAGAAPSEKADALIRQGNAALGQFGPEAALEIYGRAEDLTDDPGLVAYDEALALYQLRRFREAEAHFLRAREDASGDRLARVLLGLGNSLVRRAGSADVTLLQQAIRRYEECLRITGLDPERAIAAGHNLEIARLLLNNARLKKDAKSTASTAASAREPDDNHPDEPLGGRDSDQETRPGNQVRPDGKVSRDAEEATGSRDNQPLPGRGNLPPVPDSEELAPLSPDDAALFLRNEADRILRERQEHGHASMPVISKGVKDW